MERLKVKCGNVEEFKSDVFGGDDLLKHFPQLLTDGVYVEYIKHNYYILDDDFNPVNDTAFFTSDELEYLVVL